MRLPKIKDYPDSVIIGEETYSVKFVRSLNGSCGECDQENKEIEIARNQSAPELLYTFIHEVLHGIEKEHGIKLSHKMVYQLERAIGDFLMKNF